MTLEVELHESRYDRQERIRWWDQDRLASARVLVVGAGALGNEIVKNLALIGVGSIVVIDFDVVEHSNLARCVFFRDGDNGAPKAATLARRASELNAAIDVHAVDGDLRALGTGIALRADVLIGALDSREARLYLNRLARRAGKPWVDGAIEGLTGVARVFHPDGPCYECTLTDADFEALAHRQSCRLLSRDEMEMGKVPTTATMASVVGGLQSQEVVKLLHRDREGVTVLDGAWMIDGINNDAYIVRYSERDDCLAHHQFDEPITLRADGATAEAVVRAAGWTSGLVELGDDYAVGWRCTACGATTDEGRAISLLTYADARCPACGEDRQPVALSTVEVPGPLAAKSLSVIGLRDDEVLAVRQGVDYRYVWLRSSAPDLPVSWR